MELLPELMTAREVAAALRLDRSTVLRWAREGEIRVVRIGSRTVRIPRAEVERILAGEPVTS